MRLENVFEVKRSVDKLRIYGDLNIMLLVLL